MFNCYMKFCIVLYVEDTDGTICKYQVRLTSNICKKVYCLQEVIAELWQDYPSLHRYNNQNCDRHHLNLEIPNKTII